MAKTMNKKISETTVRIGEVRFFYCYCFSPKPKRPGDPEGTQEKYSVQILIPKTNTEAVSMIEAAVDAAIENGIAKRWNGKRPPAARFHMPLRDGDEEYPDDPNYEGMLFFNASNLTAPGVFVVDRDAGGLRKAVEGEVYSGAYGAAKIEFYPYAASGSNGIAASLQGLFKTRDGERMGGGGATAGDFDDLEDLAEGDAEDWMN